MFYLTKLEANHLQRQAEASIDKSKVYKFDIDESQNTIMSIITHPHNIEEDKYYTSVVPNNGKWIPLTLFCQINNIRL